MPSAPSTPLPEKIAALLPGLLYISEGEAPVELLHWPGIQNIEAARQYAATLNSDQPEAYTLQSTPDFLRPIQQMADADPGMQDIDRQWWQLIEELRSNLCDVQVILGPVKDSQQQIYIIGFTDSGALALHTTAVMT